MGSHIYIVLVEYLTADFVGSDPIGLYFWPISNLLGSAEKSAGHVDGKKE